MITIALSKTEYLRLRKIESLYRRRHVSTGKVSPSEADAFLARWGGAFAPIDPANTSDIRLQAIHKKHVK
jgi:hypothetical protein